MCVWASEWWCSCIFVSLQLSWFMTSECKLCIMDCLMALISITVGFSCFIERFICKFGWEFVKSECRNWCIARLRREVLDIWGLSFWFARKPPMGTRDLCPLCPLTQYSYTEKENEWKDSSYSSPAFVLCTCSRPIKLRSQTISVLAFQGQANRR